LCSSLLALQQQVAGFLQSELPIRLAHRIRDLEQCPKLRDMPSVQVVKSIYTNSFLELLETMPMSTSRAEAEFAEVLEGLYQKHSKVLIQMARGAYELKSAVRQGHVVQGRTTNNNGIVETFEQLNTCHTFLDRFYASRVGIRVLAGQYLALRHQIMEKEFNDPSHHHQSSSKKDGSQQYVGMICLNTSPSEIVRQAAQEATRMCRRKYGRAPHVTIQGRLDLTFPYIPSHLHYIILELLKNAMRATMETHYVTAASAKSTSSTRSGTTTLEPPAIPEVTVIIADGNENEDVVIKIMDEGGGIPRSQMDKIWSYLFTTAEASVQESFLGDNASAEEEDHSNASPIAGLGYGLPISRAYARYFGGELDIISMEGYGTDAFCYLARLGDKEPLLV
jgi:pyruvate dehydrogenase kinase 2/3/4